MRWRHQILTGLTTAVASAAVAIPVHAPKFVAAPGATAAPTAPGAAGSPNFDVANARPLTPWPSPFPRLAEGLEPGSPREPKDHRAALLQRPTVSAPELRHVTADADPATLAAGTPRWLPGPRTLHPDPYTQPPLAGFMLPTPVTATGLSPATVDPDQLGLLRPAGFGLQPFPGPFDFGPGPILIDAPAVALPSSDLVPTTAIAVPEPGMAAILIAAPLLLLRRARRPTASS